jgi:hypothetical protein
MFDSKKKRVRRKGGYSGSGNSSMQPPAKLPSGIAKRPMSSDK